MKHFFKGHCCLRLRWDRNFRMLKLACASFAQGPSASDIQSVLYSKIFENGKNGKNKCCFQTTMAFFSLE